MKRKNRQFFMYKTRRELIKEHEEMLKFLINGCFQSVEMWIDASCNNGQEFSFSEWKLANKVKVDFIERISQKSIEELLKGLI